MQATKLGRLGMGAMMALLISQSIAWAGTVAHWRFEEGPADANVLKGGLADGVFYPGVADSSGNGNALSAWSEGGCCGYAYRTNVAAAALAQTGAANNFSVSNTGGGPGLFTQTGAAIQTISPAAFTVEASFMPETGGYRTIVGRDSRGSVPADQALAALYLQLLPDHAIAIKFADVSGYWHEAVSAPGVIQGYTFPDSASGHWYHVAAVSDGFTLSLYLNDVGAGTGYQLVAQTNMLLSGSPNRALTAGTGDGGDWDPGNWTVGRGLHNGNHVDRCYGFIDEVRISDSALAPSEFLFAFPSEVMQLSPSTLDVAPVDPPTSVNLVIPASCNASQAVDVTVTSDNAASAKPAGSAGSTSVHFPAGGVSTAPVSIEFGSAGQANFTLAAAGACPPGPGSALTVTVHSVQSVSLMIANDVMRVGLVQQASVTGDFGVAGTRDVSAGSLGTTYAVEPSGVINVSADGQITAVALGTATITATYGGITSSSHVIAVLPPSPTVAYWRFEEGPLDANVARGGKANGIFYPGVADSSGNGNALSAWSDGGFAGYAYRTDLSESVIPKTSAANNFSVQNTGGSPGMFTQTGAPIQTISPAAFTVEASFKPESGGYRTLIGRDSQGAATENAAYAALYLQLLPGNAIAIKFADVSGYWHQAVSATGVFQSFTFPDTAAGQWYHVAAVSDGNSLSLYLNDVEAGTGYQLIAQTDMTLSGSPNRALTAGLGDGSDWDPGNWSVGRGLFNGGHTDRYYGLIDEVRISEAALQPSQFLFTPEYTVIWPETVDLAPVDAPSTVSVVIPNACNDSQAVDVTVTSDNPAVAKPAGSTGSAVVHFPAGNGRLMQLPIEVGEVGVAHFSLSTTSTCPVVPGTALTVNVHAATSIDLQVTHDVMRPSLTQQARVIADFGAAGKRDIAAGSTGTTYAVAPSGVVSVSADGLITAVDLGTATITASYESFTSLAKTVAVKTPDPRLKVAGSGVLLVDLKASDSTAGQAVWVNKGSLGDFAIVGQPVVGNVAGQNAVSFNGADAYQGPLAPVELLGGQGRTIEVWVLNPALDGAVEGERVETMVSWGYRGGPDGSLLTFNYGEQPEWGGVGAWGTGKDMGWYPDVTGSPALGQWHHLVYTYDPAVDGGTTTLFDNGVQVNSKVNGEMPTHLGHINLCMQNLSANALDFHTSEIGILSLAVVRIHDGALSPADVEFNYLAGISGRGQVPPDLNLDSHVDLLDMPIFLDCAGGPGVPLTQDCEFVDFDLDGDADQVDFAIYQRCYTGPDIVATPDCMQ